MVQYTYCRDHDQSAGRSLRPLFSPMPSGTQKATSRRRPPMSLCPLKCKRFRVNNSLRWTGVAAILDRCSEDEVLPGRRVSPKKGLEPKRRLVRCLYGTQECDGFVFGLP